MASLVAEDTTGASSTEATAFLTYVENWMAARPSSTLEALLEEAGGPEHVGVFCVDVINGFCHEGPLHSERVRNIIPPIVRLFERAHAAGIRHFVLPQDTHDAYAAEFKDYPPHCIRGTDESRTVPELANLPFAEEFHIVPKNAVHSGVGTGLNAWLNAHPQITHRIVVGDCTDLCTYHLALHLKFCANAENQLLPVILPMNCVDTYDTSLETAQKLNIPAHPANVFHPLFLYSMGLNGVRVVQEIA